MALRRAGVAIAAILFLSDVLHVSLALQENDEKFAFLNPQTRCLIRCENGGVCAFSIRNPRRHKCICFVGMYYGARCEHKTETSETSTTTPSVVEYSSTVAVPNEKSMQEHEDYTTEWKDFGKEMLHRESPEEEEWAEESQEDDVEALPDNQEYRYDQSENAEYKDYYQHPKHTSVGYGKLVFTVHWSSSLPADDHPDHREVTIPTTTQKWDLSKNVVESQEYVNDDGSQEDGWMMVVRKPANFATSAFICFVLLVAVVFLVE
ncbi:hypothetical protein QR680_012951 [Steinernema hermaphroditum]|uniref:EGF-like domain-containing protein n=1 Tax=Steinernema hermaphroditum TaxID=289476 RepID=A0AA39I3V3_9BILA|nr:hypothetical protein QR680_012951 [Steinernema hermaphroditum]